MVAPDQHTNSTNESVSAPEDGFNLTQELGMVMDGIEACPIGELPDTVVLDSRDDEACRSLDSVHIGDGKRPISFSAGHSNAKRARVEPLRFNVLPLPTVTPAVIEQLEAHLPPPPDPVHALHSQFEVSATTQQ